MNKGLTSYAGIPIWTIITIPPENSDAGALVAVLYCTINSYRELRIQILMCYCDNNKIGASCIQQLIFMKGSGFESTFHM